jgi:hypothetical protein
LLCALIRALYHHRNSTGAKISMALTPDGELIVQGRHTRTIKSEGASYKLSPVQFRLCVGERVAILAYPPNKVNRLADE